MKKGCYVISIKDFNEVNKTSVGIYKKILSQINSFHMLGYECTLVNLPVPSGNLLVKFLKLFSKNLYPNLDVSNYDFMYIRKFNHACKGVFSLLTRVRQSNPNIKIILEIPTWPYDAESRTFVSKIRLIVDKIFRNQLHHYVDLITTYSNDKSIFGIPALPLKNGVDCSSLPVARVRKQDTNVRLIAVAQFSFWHGYERLIEGLKNYYSVSREIEVFITFVGFGDELERYVNLVKKYELDSYISFKGKLGGVDLDILFDESDMAVCSLGAHRKDIFVSSELKSREYMARGMPMVSSTIIDVLPPEYEYVLMLPSDESPVDIEKLVMFYNRLKEQYSVEQMRQEIRNFAEQNCDMKVVMQPVVDYIEKTNFSLKQTR